MSEFLQRVEAAMPRHPSPMPGKKILVAVSGGVDSMVLLHSLHSLAKKNHWKLSVAHFNHRLRGRASNADEKLVRQTAAELDLKFLGGGADVKGIAAQSKISIEMAARKLRHEFLARTARAQDISTIALAHHADDQVELFFLRLLRGAGGEGLAGMKPRSPSPADKSITLIRPLLDFSKAELLAFARENQIRFRHDATNFSSDFLRNRIRNQLLPLLRKNYQPGLDKIILRLMNIVGAESEFVGEAAKQLRADARPHGSRREEAPSKILHLKLPRAREFAQLPLAIQRKALQQQLAALGLMPDFELVEQLRVAPEKKLSVAPGLTVLHDAAGKVYCREQSINALFNIGQLALKLTGKKGGAEFGGRKFRWSVEVMKRLKLPLKKLAGGPPALREFFDADKIGGEIILRHWQPGDRFQPIGLRSSVKLQDLFMNAKIPAAQRRELVVAATKAGQIFWVEGLRIAEEFKLTAGTRRKLSWTGV